MENNPIIAGTSCIPLAKFRFPNEYLAYGKIFMPTIPSSSPNTAATSPLSMLPPERLPTMVKPKIAIRKYSGELNISDTFTSCGARKSRATALITPPVTELILDTPTAFRPFPCLVSSYPSMAVAAEAGVPGVWIRIAEKLPPYTAET